ncbi:hypothetical protein EX30DRAFT_397539 [Ascodesmis nigricans]|uniref:Uncharacterized protein n=1 Tax=Ascodesmis nigricans TaxID=341454 RepID=A0A4S2MPA1_9PEZI|nr:hypothetical protein EX30DRAFT_397539 [Ascodesmis nigricans]
MAPSTSTSLTKHHHNHRTLAPASPPRDRSSSSVNSNGGASASNGAAPNIWQMMNYPIPRGRCKHKPSLLASSCPCLRFMLNPIQAASTYSCDGCGHHASFHVLKNDEDGDADFVDFAVVGAPRQVAGVKRREIVDLSEEEVEEEDEERGGRGENGGRGRRLVAGGSGGSGREREKVGGGKRVRAS